MSLDSNSEIEVQVSNSILSVLSNVNYTDLPIIGIIVYHIIEFIIAIIVGKTRFHRSLMFCYCLMFCAYGEKIKQYCKANLDKLHFSKDYFDDKNIFLFIFFQLPTLLSAFVLALGLLIDYIKYFKNKKNKNQKTSQNQNKKDSGNKNEEKIKNN